ncbi:transforming acidic coiled-coil-containing protein 3-like [Saccostrea echinata]|uniref:transforming acidic coiled-coil-containing protein 3-like n=1 Tax=Saccostrea echinata TaxID=191078 RepID=UPI002A82DF64|nr:transforming acidic coiled-coil-containing protein 3-like [Saccostrea echinata]
MDENLMEFSLNENSENSCLEDLRPPMLMQTPQVVKKSILKPSQQDNLIQLCTPIHKGLKVKFETPHNVKKSTPTRFEEVRMLDEQENWIERTSIVTKDQHQEYLEMARDIMMEVINNLPLEESEVVQPNCKSSKDRLEEDMDTDDFFDAVDEIEKITPKKDNIEDMAQPDEESKMGGGPQPVEEQTEKLGDVSEKAEETETENSSKEPSSPPLPASKGSYNIDFDNLEDVNPFATKMTVQNSPLPLASRKVQDLTNANGKEAAVSEMGMKNVREDDNPEEAFQSKEEDKRKGSPESMEEKKGKSEEVQEKEKPVTQESSSPTLPISKGSYNIDFDKLDDINPFATKVAVQNSPVTSASGIVQNSPKADEKEVEENDERKEGNTSLSEFQSVKDNPFIRLIESPAIKEKKKELVLESIVAEQSEDIFSQSFEDIDPFQPKKQLMNSPEVSRKTTNSDDHPDTCVPSNSPKNHVESRNVEISLEENDKHHLLDSGNIKQPLSQSAGLNVVLTSEVKGRQSPVSQIKEKKDLGSSEIDGSIDPFATKANVMNSPKREGDENIDPMMKQSNISNSPEKPAFSDDDFNPFATKSKVVNSPAPTTCENEMDPFKSKSKIVNSPEKKSLPLQEPDPFATVSKVANSPLKEAFTENVVPFATKCRVINSPSQNSEESEKDPCVTKSEVDNFPAKLPDEDIDPFATKAKVANSPAQKNIDDEFDPFATKSNVANSPTSQNDPFATKSKVAFSPNGKSEEDINPFVSKSKVANSPAVKTEEGNPFATKPKVANSPVKATNLENLDPFASNSKIANSPQECKKPDDGSSKQSKEPSDMKSGVEKLPIKDSVETASENMEKQGKNNFEKLLMDSETCVSPFSGLNANKMQDASFKLQNDPFKTPTGSAKKTPKKSCPFTNMSEFGLSDDDFKPASSTLFSDPADFDILEQFGSNKGIAESALSRMSLYVKFDPLVDLPVADPRRASIDVRRMSMKRGGTFDPRLRQLEPDESMLLMGTPPRGPGQSRVVPVVKNQTPVNTKAVTSNDLLCSDIPEGRTEVTDVIKDTLSLNQTEGDGIIEVLQYTEADISRIKQTLALEFQGILLDNQKEWSQKLAEEEKKHGKKLEEVKAQMSQEIDKNRAQCQKAEDKVKQMASVVQEFEAMINEFVEEREKLKTELKHVKQELQKANEQTTQESKAVDTLEASFSALHKRYGKTKEILENSLKNEETLKACVEDYMGRLKKADEQILKVKQMAEEKLKAAHEELEKVKSNSRSETARLEALVKRKEMQLESKEKALEQKGKEFNDLSDICDQLMQKLESRQ